MSTRHFLVAHDRLAKHIAWIIAPAVLLSAAVVQAETPQAVPSIQPIREPLASFNSACYERGRCRNGRRHSSSGKRAKVFDAFMMQKFPPTLSDEKGFNSRANALIKEVGGRFIIATLTPPVWQGKAGKPATTNAWRRNSPHGAGITTPAKPLPQLEWLETFKDLQSDTWALGAGAAGAHAHAGAGGGAVGQRVRPLRQSEQHKQAVIWLSAEAFGQPSLQKGMLEKMLLLQQRICEATAKLMPIILPGWTCRARRCRQANPNGARRWGKYSTRS